MDAAYTAFGAAVTEAFHAEPAKLDEITELFGDITDDRVNLATGLARVGEFLKDHPNLLIAFNATLPDEAKIPIPPDPNRTVLTDVNKGLGQLLGRRVSSELTIDDSRAYISAVKEAFKDEPEKYKEFLHILKYLDTHRENIGNCYARVKDLMKDHPNLFLGFSVFLPAAAKITIPPVANNGPEITSDVWLSYITAVQEAFYDEPARYKEFIKLLTDYRAHKIDVASTIERVDEIMKDHPNLLLGFIVFLPAEAEQPTHSDAWDFVKKVRKLKDVYQHEPAKYQELKKLLKDYRARSTLSSLHQDYPRAYNLVAKVEERFQGDDSHVYESFLQILRMHREGNMSRDELYHEVTTLLQDHQDLVMEFSFFFNK